MVKINEIEDFSWPSEKLWPKDRTVVWQGRQSWKSYKPRKRKINWIEWAIFYGTVVTLIAGIALILGMSVFALFSSFTPKAEAQVKTAKDCMTNEECLALACAEGSPYINKAEICHGS